MLCSRWSTICPVSSLLLERTRALLLPHFTDVTKALFFPLGIDLMRPPPSSHFLLFLGYAHSHFPFPGI